jgi:unsaturated rhamnogalacturonyl hydrolase
VIASTIFTHSLGLALFAAAPAQAKTAAPHGGAIGVAVADTMLRRWPELDATPADCTGLANCFSLNFATVPPTPAPKFWEYTYGVPLMGLQRLYERTRDARYLAYIKKYVDRYVDAAGTISYARPWPLGHDGQPPPPNDPTIQDVIQPSTLLFGLYDATHDDRYLKAMTATRQIFRVIKTSRVGVFWHKPSYPDQQWLDGIYMSEPFLVRYGALFADQVKPGDAQLCFRTATGQIEVAAEHTLDPKTKLYYHAWNDALDGAWRGLAPPTRVPPPAGAKTSPVLWSRAIGWYIAGIVDVLEHLPANDPERPALRAILRNLAEGLEHFQDRKTGLWYQVIDMKAGPLPATGGYAGERDRPAQPNWLETSASAIFAYSLAKAVRLGELPARYRAVAIRAWNGVKTRIDVDGSGTAHIHGTVVGLSVGGTYNAYVNADMRGPSQLSTGEPPAPASCPTAAQLPPGTTPPIACKYIYVRDDVPQGFGAVLLASSELEFTTARHSTTTQAPAPTPVARSK